MRIRLRSSGGASVVEVNEDASLSDLLLLVREKEGRAVAGLKCGYPPRPVALASTGLLKSLGIRDGEQLLVELEKARQEPRKELGEEATTGQDEHAPPEVPCNESVMTLRVMEDDNSCLFRAVGYVCMRSLDAMVDLRALVASTIQEDGGRFYSEAVLGRGVDEYCAWITRPDSWGGGIELQILAKHFAMELCSIDVASGRMDRFNEGMENQSFLVYSGIHYDCLALSPGSELPAEFDQTVVPSVDPSYMEAASRLCSILRSRHYYTDTAKFTLACLQCGTKLVGERDAQKHAEQTMHTRFGEYS